MKFNPVAAAHRALTRMITDLEKKRRKDARRSSDHITLTADELAAMIDREARDRLGISGEEFTRRYDSGTLEDSHAATEIAMLLRLRE